MGKAEAQSKVGDKSTLVEILSTLENIDVDLDEVLVAGRYVAVPPVLADGEKYPLRLTQDGKLITYDPTVETKVDAVEGKLDSPISGLASIRTGVQNVETDVNLAEEEIKFTSDEVLDDIAAIGPTNTTERTITVTIPAGSTIRRVVLAAFITVMNDSANAQKIDVTVQGRVPPGGWNNYFSENDCIGVPNVDAASTGLVALSDVSALVTIAGVYGFRLSVTQTSANSVHYTTQYLLLVTYRMS